jgi:hypothetical protein
MTERATTNDTKILHFGLAADGAYPHDRPQHSPAGAPV